MSVNYYAVAKSIDHSGNVCNQYPQAFGSKADWIRFIAKHDGLKEEWGHWECQPISEIVANSLIELYGCHRHSCAEYTDTMYEADAWEQDDEEWDY